MTINQGTTKDPIRTSTKNTVEKETPKTPLFANDYRIYINHTDAGGIVYHANHLVFFENCRRDWFTKVGIDGYFIQGEAGEIQHFVASQAQLYYRKAIFLDELISVRIDKIELKPASIIFYQSIHRNPLQSADAASQAKAGDTLLSTAKIVIACVQNQVQSDSAVAQQANASSTAKHTTSIRPIRVPNKLHSIIQQAIEQHAELVYKH